jgi:hypothetical protein
MSDTHGSLGVGQGAPRYEARPEGVASAPANDPPIFQSGQARALTKASESASSFSNPPEGVVTSVTESMEDKAERARQLDAAMKTQAMATIETTMRTTLPQIMNKPLVSMPADVFLHNKPSAPCFWYYNRDTIFSLPSVYLDVTVSIHLSTAIVSMRVAFANTSDRTIDGVFALPLKGTVTAVQAKIGQDRYVQSEIINNEDISRLNAQLAAPRVSRQIPLENVSEYVPDLFRLPILGVSPKEVVQIEIDYIETLSFFHGSYGFNLPLSFAPGLRPEAAATAIRGSVFAMSSEVRIMSASHALEVTDMGTHKRFNVIMPSSEELADLASNLDNAMQQQQARHEQRARRQLQQQLQQQQHPAGSSQAAEQRRQQQQQRSAEHAGPVSSSHMASIAGSTGSSRSGPGTTGASPAGSPDVTERASSPHSGRAGAASPAGSTAAGANASAASGASTGGADPEGGDVDGTEADGDSRTGAPSVFAAAPVTPLDVFNLHFELPLGDTAGSVLKSVDKRTEILGADGQVESIREEGSFVVFVAPPSVERIEKQFRRNFIFLIDRSGSMSGQPYEEALRGLRVALSKLGPYDKFNIMAFDHNMMALHEDMVPATARNVEVAFNWVREKKPAFGGTTIEAPLRWALSLLGKIQKGLNFVFLLTDGAVENDREICRMAVQAAGNTRILTFGIGTFCNWYFLQMLASLTRGFNATAVYHEHIYEQVTMLLSMAELPVLTDLTIDMENVDDCQIYPFPLPDLFLGAPLVVAGKYSAVRGFPAGIMLRGDDAAGMSQMVYLPVTEDPSVPVARVFLKQRMDLLVAKAWLDDSRTVRQEVIDLSIKSRMPSPFTTMVTFEMTPDERTRYEQELERAGREEEEGKNVQKTREADERDRAAKENGGEGKDKGDEAKRMAMSKALLSNSERRTEYIAASAIGAIVAVGAVAAAFGNVGATMTNAASIIAGGFGTVGASAIECCNECDCDCIVDVFEGITDCC